MGSYLAILLAALRKTCSPEDADTQELGNAMASASRTRRQVWLAQTSLPGGFKKEVIGLPVQAGQVLSSGSQELLENLERAQWAKKSVQRMIHKQETVTQSPEQCEVEGF